MPCVSACAFVVTKKLLVSYPQNIRYGMILGVQVYIMCLKSLIFTATYTRIYFKCILIFFFPASLHQDISVNGVKFKPWSNLFSTGAMEKGGVGALELVAMDMKARCCLDTFIGRKCVHWEIANWLILVTFRGMYVCRTLSYKGAEFEIVEVPLEAKMTVPCIICHSAWKWRFGFRCIIFINLILIVDWLVQHQECITLFMFAVLCNG